jgi:hypothetical protein
MIHLDSIFTTGPTTVADTYHVSSLLSILDPSHHQLTLNRLPGGMILIPCPSVSEPMIISGHDCCFYQLNVKIGERN